MNSPSRHIDWSDVKRRLQRSDDALNRVLQEDPSRREAVYARRAAALANRRAPEGDAEIAARSVSLLVFRVGDQRYGLPLCDVVKVTRLPACAPVPGGPAELVGLMTLAGEPRSVLDLGRVLHVGGQRDAPDGGHVLFVRAAERAFALRVDEVLTTESATPAELEALAGPAGLQARYARGRTAGGVVVLSAALLHDGLFGGKRPLPSETEGIRQDAEPKRHDR